MTDKNINLNLNELVKQCSDIKTNVVKTTEKIEKIIKIVNANK